MKKTIKLLSLLLTICMLLFAVACTQNSDISSPLEPSKEFVITVTLPEEGGEPMTLLAYMQSLKADGKFDFEIEVSSGMSKVTSINGLKNTTKSYWMLYTDDGKNSNTAWGTYDYDEKVLGSAALGADSLVVKNGGIYIWAYQTF